jgi:restriction system protein
MSQWDPVSPEAKAVRAIARGSNLPELTDPERWELYAPWLAHADPAIRANALICLIHQANYLLDQQLAALEEAFIEEGGYSEQLATARLTHRTHSRHANRQDPPDRPDPANPIPQCPQCAKPMALRTAKAGPNTGRQFWGCTGYPTCRGTAEV